VLITFVNPPLYGLPTPPYSLVLLGTVARRCGFDVRIVDFNLWKSFEFDRMADAVLADRPDAVAFTCWGNATPFCLRLAKMVRAAAPDVWLLAGGPMIRPGWHEFPRIAAAFDVLVEGEGEAVLPGLLDAVRAGRPRPEDAGRLVRASTPDVAVIPLPEWGLLDSLEAYREPALGLRLPIQAGRGCAYNCSFCSVREFWGKVRLREPDVVAAEIAADLDRYGANMILFYDDNFTGDPDWVGSLVETFRRDLPPFKWVASTRIDLVPPQLAASLADAGAINLFFGIESASERVRKLYRKNFKIDVLDALRRVSEAGIATEVSLVFGSPADGPEVMRANLDFIDACVDCGVSYFHSHVLFPIPDTAVARDYARAIIRNPFPRVTQPSLADTPDDYYQFISDHGDLCLDFWMFSPRDMTVDAFFAGFFDAVLKKRHFTGGHPLYMPGASQPANRAVIYA
jgi:radical SAM superfamily enzyme YgiQ (UPF0313 family)